MPTVKITDGKGLVQESGSGLVVQSTADLQGQVEVTGQVAKMTNFYPNGTSAKTTNFTAAAGYVYLVTKADGCAVTLPTPTAGDRIKIVSMTGVTSNNHVITSPSGYLLSGFVTILDLVDGTASKSLGFAPDGSDDRVITLNGGTTGGLGGDIVELVGVALGGTAGWYVEGRLLGKDSVATPFS